jgi:glycosyltransferase involved in cell wall biosynthesis
MYRLFTEEMKVYFYHTQDTERILKEWKEGLYPGHLLYGATHLPKYGVEVIPHLYKPFYDHRLKLTLLTAWRILTCRKKYDALYATSFRGIEGLIFLRALGLYRKPIVIWHHQPIVEAKGWLRERVSRLFYRGIDHMFFFSQQLVDESLKAKKARKERMQVVPWGPDLAFYDHVLKEGHQRSGFISTGKEQRDLPTLIGAFSKVEKAKLTMYINEKTGDLDYTKVLGGISVPENVKINVINRLMIGELAQIVNEAECITICCRKSNYTVGLTTLVEALALGTPVITTRNETFPYDVDEEGVGISVPYYDVEAWEQAIRYITEHPAEAQEMGRKARALVERKFNLENTSQTIAESILRLMN